MDRREFLERTAAGSLGLAGIGSFTEGTRAAASRGMASDTEEAEQPNLLFVMADQLRTMSCGYAGDRYGGTYADEPAPYTPNMDRIADESADFRQAVSVYPMCSPHRASLMTGKYPSSTGMVINELRAMPDPDAIAHVLEENGYRTAFIGKWHLFGKHHGTKQQFIPPSPYRLGFDHWEANNFNHKYYEGFYFRDTFNKIDIDGFQPNTFTDLAVDFMREAQADEQPFALFLFLGPPHDPFTWPNTPDFLEHLFKGKDFPDPPNYTEEGAHAKYWIPKWDHEWWEKNWKPKRFGYRQAYAALTSSVDWELGRLDEAVDELVLTDDTIFVFHSDHGEMFGSQGRIAKKIFYEEAARVPFLVRWPDEVEPQVLDIPLNTPDIAPTLLGLMGIPAPHSMEGMDLSDLARGHLGPEPEAAFMQGMGHTFRWQDGDEWRAVRTDRYTYAKLLADGSEYLFDNYRDPYQQNNLVGQTDHRDTYHGLKTLMNERMKALNDPFKPTTWYRDHWIEDRVIVQSATRELEEKYRPENIPLPHLDESDS